MEEEALGEVLKKPKSGKEKDENIALFVKLIWCKPEFITVAQEVVLNKAFNTPASVFTKTFSYTNALR